MNCTLKLTNAQVIDGTGAPALSADVALDNDRIVAVGDLGDLATDRTLDCSGKTITPGFIDIHSHSDWLVPGADHGAVVEPFLRQGMTSLVGGNCGFSPAPLSEHNRHSAEDASRLIVDDALDLQWTTMAEFLDALDAGGLALNVAQLVGHGAVRSSVTGTLNTAARPPPTSSQQWSA